MSAVMTPANHPHASTPAGGPTPWKWTREQYYKLGELGFFTGRRVQLIRGEIIEMSPLGWPHVLGKAKVANVLRRIFAGVGWVNEQAPLQAPESEPEPDVSVIPGQMEDYTDHPTVALLVVEVAETSLFYDTTTKAELYASSGILDYWVLDLENRQLLVFRDPAPIPAGGMAYRTRLVFGPTETVAPLAASTATISISELLP